MEITISPISGNIYSKIPTDKIPPKTEPDSGTLLAKTINLNNDPKAVEFMGRFFNREDIGIYGTPRVYGRFQLTKKQLDQDMRDASIATEHTMKMLRAVQKERPLKEKDIDLAADMCISCLAYFTNTPTTYNMFEDTLRRCTRQTFQKDLDRKKDGLAASVFNKMVEKIRAYGEEVEPGSKNLFRAGAKYIYYADDLPYVSSLDTQNNISPFSYKFVSKFIDKQFPNKPKQDIVYIYNDRPENVYPRCHMSTVENEIKDCNIDPIIQKYSRELQDDKIVQSDKPVNLSGFKVNKNFQYVPISPNLKINYPKQGLIRGNGDPDDWDIIEPY